MKKTDLSPIGVGIKYPPSKKGYQFLHLSFEEPIGIGLAQAICGEYVGTNGYAMHGCDSLDLGGGDFLFFFGWIYIESLQEVFQFNGGFVNITDTAVLQVQTDYSGSFNPTLFTDGSSQNVHANRRLVVVDGASGSGLIDYNDLKTIQPYAGRVTNPSALITKVLEIGDWKMQTDANAFVPHGLADVTKIRSVVALIRNDSNQYFDFLTLDGRITFSTAASIGDIVLYRNGGSLFDDPNYDSGSFNRGWLTIIYEP